MGLHGGVPERVPDGAPGLFHRRGGPVPAPGLPRDHPASPGGAGAGDQRPRNRHPPHHDRPTLRRKPLNSFYLLLFAHYVCVLFDLAAGAERGLLRPRDEAGSRPAASLRAGVAGVHGTGAAGGGDGAARPPAEQLLKIAAPPSLSPPPPPRSPLVSMSRVGGALYSILLCTVYCTIFALLLYYYVFAVGYIEEEGGRARSSDIKCVFVYTRR